MRSKIIILVSFIFLATFLVVKVLVQAKVGKLALLLQYPLHLAMVQKVSIC